MEENNNDIIFENDPNDDSECIPLEIIDDNEIARAEANERDSKILKNIEDNTEEKKKTPKKKKEKLGIVNITKPINILKFKSLNPDIVLNTKILNFSTSTEMVELKESWIELLVWLVGCLNHKEPKNFIYNIYNSLALSDTIRITDNPNHEYFEYEINAGLEIYKIPDTEYFIEYIPNNVNLFKAYSMLFQALGCELKEVKFKLQRLDKSNNKKSEDRKLVYIDYTINLNQAIQLENKTPLLGATALTIYEQTVECNNLNHLIVLMLTTICGMDQENIDIILNNSIKDIVGVTKDSSEYNTVFETIKIPIVNSEKLYFYTNGQVSKTLEYLRDVCETIEIDSDEILISYRDLMIMEE